MRRRISLLKSVALAAALMPAAVGAQSTNVAAPASTPAPPPTPAPAPAGDSVGPPQLRDFNLNGTVTRPAQPETPAPRPTPGAAQPPATPAPAEATPVRPAPVSREPIAREPEIAPSQDQLPVDLAPSAPLPSELDPALIPVPEAAPAPDTGSIAVPEQSSWSWWPWLAAAVAAALGAGLLWRRRDQRDEELRAIESGALGALVTESPAAPARLPRAMPQPQRAIPAAPPPAVPVRAQEPAVPGVAPPDGIIASRLKPELGFELEPIRAESDSAEGAAVTFDLIIINRGSAPARDVLIEAQLINANAQVDAAVGRFFNQPGGVGDRLPMIAPMSRVSIRTRLGVAAADLAPLVVEGRKLFVPIIAINANYRWSGGERKDSSSFLIGRGEADGGKMAPFRLDQGARSWSGLAARLHSSGLAS